MRRGIPAGTRTCVPVTPSAIDETIKPKGFTDANTSAFANHWRT